MKNPTAHFSRSGQARQGGLETAGEGVFTYSEVVVEAQRSIAPSSTAKTPLKKMRIALIAHDKKKDDMIKLAIEYKDVLSHHELFATGTTGTLVMGETGLAVNRMKSGPLGGDQQIGSMVAEGKLDLIVFLRDPLTSQPHEPDVSALLRLCDVQSIPLATNVASAKIMLSALVK